MNRPRRVKFDQYTNDGMKPKKAYIAATNWWNKLNKQEKKDAKSSEK